MAPGQLCRALGSFTLFSDLTGGTVIRCDQEYITGRRYGSKAEHRYRCRRLCILHIAAILIKHRSHAAV